MKEEEAIVKKSIPIFLVVAAVTAGIGLLFGEISYVLGLALGYGINLIIFKIITITVDNILLFRSKISAMIVMFSYLIKMVVYGFGFFLAVKLPSVFNIFTVTIGYFMIKLTIFYYDYRIRKRGEGM